MTWDTATWSKTLARIGVKPKEVTEWSEPFARKLGDVTFKQGRRELIEFLTQILHESGRLTTLTENLNYTPIGLLNTFGMHRITEEVAKKLGRIDGIQPADQKGIANQVYGGAWGKKNLGNVGPEDGWNYRGSGLIQTTGLDNFKYLKTMSGIDVVTKPELARQPGDAAVTFAILMWQRRVKPEIVTNEVECRRAVNGGTLGIEDCRTIRTTVTSILG